MSDTALTAKQRLKKSKLINDYSQLKKDPESVKQISALKRLLDVSNIEATVMLNALEEYRKLNADPEEPAE